MRVILIVAFLMGLAGPVSAVTGAKNAMIGKHLHELCQSRRPGNGAFCAGYIGGVMDAIAAGGGRFLLYRICFPDEITIERGESVVKPWLSKHPERHSYSAASLVAGALYEKWPCK
jgi:hypothetical protein